MILKTILAGIGATALMTSFVYLIDLILKEQLKVVRVLGTMLTGQTTPNKGLSGKPSAIISGLVGHYVIGIIFALTFLWLLNIGIVEITFLDGIIFGAFAGLIGVIGWKVYFSLHPNPPIVQLNLYFLTIFLGHIIFGIGLILIYKLSKPF